MSNENKKTNIQLGSASSGDDKGSSGGEKPVKKEKVFDVSCRLNRVFEVRVKKETFRFEPRVTNPVSPAKKVGNKIVPIYKDGVPESIVKSSGFQAQIGKLIIKEKK